MIYRVVKLPKHNNVLIGRDLSQIFKNGHLIAEASELLCKDNVTKKQISEMHEKLVQALGPTDDFLFRWRAINERRNT